MWVFVCGVRGSSQGAALTKVSPDETYAAPDVPTAEKFGDYQRYLQGMGNVST